MASYSSGLATSLSSSVLANWQVLYLQPEVNTIGFRYLHQDQTNVSSATSQVHQNSLKFIHPTTDSHRLAHSHWLDCCFNVSVLLRCRLDSTTGKLECWRRVRTRELACHTSLVGYTDALRFHQRFRQWSLAYYRSRCLDRSHLGLFRDSHPTGVSDACTQLCQRHIYDLPQQGTVANSSFGLLRRPTR